MRCRRRRFLQLLGGAALLGPARLLADDDAQRLLSCRSDLDGRHYASLFDSSGRILLDEPLPARGHAIALSHDARLAAVFARRPGDFVVVIDITRQRVVGRIRARADRHFYGHGVFSSGDALLYATENAFDEQRAGRIGIYALRDGLRRVGELDSHGIGPHELCLAADGRTLIVANGGIRTHPDMPRAKLNIADMRASLAFIDAGDGALLESHTTPDTWQRLSIRHIDVTAGDTVAIAMQYEGHKTERPPLVGLHRRGSAPVWLHAPVDVQRRMRNYCGSVAFAGDGRSFAVSSPRGGLVTIWSADGGFRAAIDQADVCGIAAGRDAMWLSDGGGGLTASGNRARHFAATRWDNHLTAV